MALTKAGAGGAFFFLPMKETIHPSKNFVGDDGILGFDVIPIGTSELSFLDVPVAARLGVDDVDGALSHLLEGVALQALLA